MTAPSVHICLCVRDEAPYLLEWVAYYKSIGATEISIFFNECTDGTGRLLRKLEERGLVSQYFNPPEKAAPKKSPQSRAMERLQTMPSFIDAEWVGIFDIDEFINVHVGNRDLPSLLDRLGDEVDAISMNWMLFGSNGAIEMTDQPVTSRFRRAGRHLPFQKNRPIKTLFRPKRFRRIGLHRPTPFPDDVYNDRPLSWVNGAGARIEPKDFVNATFLPVGLSSEELVQINHYAVKSREEFVRMRTRGSGTGKNHRFGWQYWHKADLNVFEDHSIDTAKMTELLNELMADKEMSRIQKQAVDIHRQRANAARTNPDIARFLDGGAYPPLSDADKNDHLGPGRRDIPAKPASQKNPIFTNGDTRLIQDIKRYLPNLDVGLIFDVGANVGQTTSKLLNGFPQARIHAFEPGSGAFERLAQATKDLAPVQIHRLALSARPMQGHLTTNRHLTLNTLTDASGPNTEAVSVTTGDLFCEESGIHRIDLLKVDTEGFDLEVLRGFTDLLKAQGIALIRVEAGMNPGNDRHVRLGDFTDLLEPLGYRIFGLYNQVQENKRKPILRRCDAVFISTATADSNTLGVPS